VDNITNLRVEMQGIVWWELI